MQQESRLKQLRNKAKISQRDLSIATGFAKSTIGNWEIDSSMMSIKDAIKLANYFHVSLEYFVGLDESPNHDTAIKNAIKKIDLDEIADYVIKKVKNN